MKILVEIRTDENGLLLSGCIIPSRGKYHLLKVIDFRNAHRHLRVSSRKLNID